MLSVSVDKFSFPSGHASRVAGLMFFFTLLYPLNIILQVPIVRHTSVIRSAYMRKYKNNKNFTNLYFVDFANSSKQVLEMPW